GPIEILVALKNTTLEGDDIILRGISIISHSETPGLGEKIVEASFLEQFEGIGVNDVRLTKDDGGIDAISGATISSSAVVEAVYDHAKEKARDIREKRGV
ncbi:MAG: FMN-binding protein, partial [Thermoplasmata archaeon]|nr:FMN-binding protein [Thermoplasmata archaeon]